MTDKREAVCMLREQGYDVSDEEGVVMFYGTPHRDAERACKAIGYTASYGSKERRKEDAKSLANDYGMG